MYNLRVCRGFFFLCIPGRIRLLIIVVLSASVAVIIISPVGLIIVASISRVILSIVISFPQRGGREGDLYQKQCTYRKILLFCELIIYFTTHSVNQNRKMHLDSYK